MFETINRISRPGMARRVAQDIKPAWVVNLGIGMPELVGNYIPPQDEVVIHTENGIIGAGPTVDGSQVDFDLINAGRKPVSLRQGGHFVDHADSFALVRGGHLDVTVLGAFQVSMRGDLANWSTGARDGIPSPGGAMDLAVGARQVFVMMELFGRNGQAKLVADCTLPLTGARVVKRLYTDMAVFDLSGGNVEVVDLVPGLTLSSLQDALKMPLTTASSGTGIYAD
ncbi:3-oxoacid CoA-transferase subunit B [Pollutimonas sp. H1-120]|uniref:3-oxoacid CoA-transferase subunit B n=1 Tax=Pollutimonas sp. H1-120 TaxID=3148824 RepID=UPI003B51B5CF